MKRVDIKTGFLCNNNCLFCVQADNKLKGNRSFEEIKNDLISSRGRCCGVVFTGGEVTIRKDFFDLVKLAKDLNYKIIQIQTNGRMFASLDFCKKAISAGATEFSPALHGYCKEQHDYLTRSSGSFNQTVKGIKNLKSLGAYVLTNTVVVKSNYTNIPQIARLLVKLNADQFQFAFVHPMGNAWKNFEGIVPRISLAAPYIHKGLQIGIDAGKSVMAEAMPYCLMKDYEDYVSLSKLIIRVEPTGEGDLTNKFKRLLIEYLSYDITSDAIDAGILSGIYNDEEYSSWMLDDFVSERLSEVAVEFKSSEIEEISECCDIDEIIQSNIDSSLQDEEQFELSRDTRITSTSSVDVIDDLFDRG